MVSVNHGGVPQEESLPASGSIGYLKKLGAMQPDHLSSVDELMRQMTASSLATWQ